MIVMYMVEKRGNSFHAVMNYEGRKKGEGVSFYSSPIRSFVADWCYENSTKG